MRGFETLLVEHMERGHSFETFSATLRYPAAVVNEWLMLKPDFIEAKRQGELMRKKTLESLLMTKQINLEIFQFLTSCEDSDIETALPNFNEDVLIQAKERFRK
jgi:hypothetical protein